MFASVHDPVEYSFRTVVWRYFADLSQIDDDTHSQDGEKQKLPSKASTQLVGIFSITANIGS